MFGYIVLYSFPLVILVLFRRMEKAKALVVSLIVGYLLLPEQLNLNLPLVPTLDKHTIPILTVFAILLAMNHTMDKTVLPGWLPKNWVARGLLLALVVGAFFTVQTNSDAQVFGPLVLPGLTQYDAISLILSTATTLLPLLLARKFLARPEHQRTLLNALVIAAVLYSFLALYEVRMSPQLNNIIYGFFPHSFLQHIRNGGFRPLVFLNHGLWLSIFLTIACLAAAGMFRVSKGAERGKYLFACLWIMFTLILSKSLGALMIALCLLPVVFIGRRLQLIVATTVAAVVIMYPILRGAGMIPLDAIMDWANSVSPERAWSLQYRIVNEEVLLAKAQDRPVVGWGTWGRYLIYNEYGIRTSTPDGYWIIILGEGGWVKYISEFGLLCLPVLVMLLRRNTYDIGVETTVLTLLLTANLFDLLPNATITPLTWMFAGALWGRIELGKISDDAEEPDVVPDGRQKVRYSRFPGTTAAAESRVAAQSRTRRDTPRHIRT
jgi:hypothetical protein